MPPLPARCLAVSVDHLRRVTAVYEQLAVTLRSVARPRITHDGADDRALAVLDGAGGFSARAIGRELTRRGFRVVGLVAPIDSIRLTCTVGFAPLSERDWTGFVLPELRSSYTPPPRRQGASPLTNATRSARLASCYAPWRQRASDASSTSSKASVLALPVRFGRGRRSHATRRGIGTLGLLTWGSAARTNSSPGRARAGNLGPDYAGPRID